MAVNNNIAPAKPIKRLFSSIWPRMMVFIVACVVLALIFSGSLNNKVSATQTTFLEDAVRRSAVQCYALEGAFPTNLNYLEENYGLIIDHTNYVVYYEQMGGNLIPQIRVVALKH
jgi:hypothetical protein